MPALFGCIKIEWEVATPEKGRKAQVARETSHSIMHGVDGFARSRRTRILSGR
jgi:hypothetical protein